MLGMSFSKDKSSRSMILKNVNLIDGLNNQLKTDMTIIIESGKITKIGKTKEISIPKSAEVLELSGKTVIPGLIDSHLHLLQSGVDDFMKPYAESVMKKLKRNAYITLKSGVTTVRNMPGAPGNSVLKFRDKINKEQILGPRIVNSGPALTIPYGYFSLRSYIPFNKIVRFVFSYIFKVRGLSIDIESEKDVEDAVKKAINNGADFIKTITPGTPFAIGGDCEKLKEELLEKGVKLEFIEAKMKSEILEAIVKEAHSQGLKVVTHTICGPDGFKKAVKIGVDSIEHTPFGLIDDETFDMMKSRNIYWVPTAYPFFHWKNLIDNEKVYDTPKMKELIPEPFHSLGKKSLKQVRDGIKKGDNPIWTRFYKQMEPFQKEYFPTNFKRAIEKGIKIVAGVDAGASGAGYVPHGQLYHELELFVKNGMSEFEAIQTATKNASELLGMENEVGTIEVGKYGDFVILDKSPLDNISNLKSIYLVIKDGEVVFDNNKNISK
ncbi:MAG: amidohydrolase family protein [Eubacteriales bacterium]